MATVACPYCHFLAHVTYVEHSTQTVDGSNPYTLTAAYTCDHCHNVLLGTLTDRNIWDEFQNAHDIELIMRSGEEVDTWIPKNVVGKKFDDVPDTIASAANEAYECHSIGAYRASTILARAVVEATAKAHGVEARNLYLRIEGLVDKGVVRKMVADAAHELRDAGNDMAHGDFATSQITEDDSAELLDFLEIILQEAFQTPTRVMRRQETSAARRASSQGRSGLAESSSLSN